MMLCLPKLVLNMSLLEFYFQHMFQQLHFLQDLEIQKTMNLCRLYSINHSLELWIFILIVEEHEWLSSIDRVEETG